MGLSSWLHVLLLSIHELALVMYCIFSQADQVFACVFNSIPHVEFQLQACVYFTQSVAAALPRCMCCLMQVNQALQLRWSDAEIKHYALLFEVWNQGFTPSTKDPSFTNGMEAR